MADLAKSLGEIVGGIAIVFYDQETHGKLIVSRIGDIARKRSMIGWAYHSGHPLHCLTSPKQDRPARKGAAV
jgi:hypothetical protein